MRTKSLITAAAASAALFTAVPVLADAAAPGKDWLEVAYSCESGEALAVAYRATGSAVRVTAPDQPAVKLNDRPARTGFRFANSLYELRGEGVTVTWQVGSRTPVRCTSDDPAASSLALAALR